MRISQRQEERTDASAPILFSVLVFKLTVFYVSVCVYFASSPLK